jgi:hypothetical protein
LFNTFCYAQYVLVKSSGTSSLPLRQRVLSQD